FMNMQERSFWSHTTHRPCCETHPSSDRPGRMFSCSGRNMTGSPGVR
ncbi:uncharacterized protein METZ01_LOCUS219837, partial [marine metagenome]